MMKSATTLKTLLWTCMVVLLAAGCGKPEAPAEKTDDELKRSAEKTLLDAQKAQEEGQKTLEHQKAFEQFQKDREATEATVRNAAVQQTIAQALRRHPMLGSLNLQVTVSGGVVTVTGEAQTPEQIDAAEKTARDYAGPFQVKTQIQLVEAKK